LSPEQVSRLWLFLNISVLQGMVVSTSPNPQAGGPPLVGCPRLLIQFIRSYPPHRRPFLYPQPEDQPCRGDRDPLHGIIYYCILICFAYLMATENRACVTNYSLVLHTSQFIDNLTPCTFQKFTHHRTTWRHIPEEFSLNSAFRTSTSHQNALLTPWRNISIAG